MWSIDSKQSVAERRSGRRNVQFRQVRRQSKAGPAVADQTAVISQVGWCTPIEALVDEDLQLKQNPLLTGSQCDFMNPAVGCHYFLSGMQSTTQTENITALWPVPSYTAW